MRHLTTTKKPVRVVADMKEFKLRVPENEVFLATARAWGAKPAPMTFSELYLALRQGVADGQENPLPTIESGKFFEVHPPGHAGGAVMTAPEGKDAVWSVDLSAAAWIEREGARLKELIAHGKRLRLVDFLPLSVLTDGAAAALGVDRRRLRPSIVIAGVDGLAEREWVGRRRPAADRPTVRGAHRAGLRGGPGWPRVRRESRSTPLSLLPTAW